MNIISDLFFVFSGSKLDFGKQIVAEPFNTENSINFVSRNSNNNGVVGRVILQENMRTFKKGDITVPLGGSYLLSAFVQDEDFVTAQNVCVLRPKRNMTDLEKWFYCYAIRENRFKFSAFGREVNEYINNIELPKYIPDWVYSSNNVLNIESVKGNNSLHINTNDWVDFLIPEIFDEIESCKCSNASAFLADGEDIEYIGAKKKNNGVMYRVQYNEKLLTKGNCVIFICDGQGSVGYTNYIENDFIGSTTLSVGRHKKLNKYSGLFLVTVLDIERYRYSFGRKYKSNLKKSKIRLPAIYNSSENKYIPDWDFMENYIKSLHYGDKL